nr:hypothetical protein [Candidatus Njordarchaeum guaymaensis]
MIGAGELALIILVAILLFTPELLARRRNDSAYRLWSYVIVMLLLLTVVALSRLVFRLLSVMAALTILAVVFALTTIKYLTHRMSGT